MPKAEPERVFRTPQWIAILLSVFAVALLVAPGRWVKLPDVGNSQSVTNSIRAWLKRSPRPDAPAT